MPIFACHPPTLAHRGHLRAVTPQRRAQLASIPLRPSARGHSLIASMGKNNRWTRGNTSAEGWKVVSGRWTQTNAEDKNWRCAGCGNTANKGWWTYCGRESCARDRPEQKPQAVDTAEPASTAASEPPAAATPTGPTLAEARRQLVCLKQNFGESHEYTTKQVTLVAKLEDDAKANVTATERLQKLWASQKDLEHKVKQAAAAVDTAQAAAVAATAKLREKLDNLDETQTDLRSLKLDVAEASAALHAESTPQHPAPTPVQAISEIVHAANAEQMASAGLTPDVLALMLQHLATLVGVAALATAPAVAVPAPAPGTPPPQIFLNVAPQLTAEQVREKEEADRAQEQQQQLQLQQQQQQLQQQQQQKLQQEAAEAEQHRLKLQQHQQQQQALLEQHRLEAEQQQQKLPLVVPGAVPYSQIPSSFPLGQHTQPSDTQVDPATAAEAEEVDEFDDEAMDSKTDARGALRSAEEIIRLGKIARTEEAPAPEAERAQVG